MHARRRALRSVSLLLLITSVDAIGQASPPPAASLADVSGCSLDNGDVFITTGQGPDARRFKYPWDTAIDAVCNARGFAIGTPRTATAAPASKPPAPVAAAAAPLPGQGSEFPADLPSPAADALKQKMAGKKYVVKLPTGTTWRLQFNSNGYYFLNVTPSGFNGSGTWRTEDGRLCTQLRGEPMACNEVRERGEVVVLKRSSGEVIDLVP